LLSLLFIIRHLNEYVIGDENVHLIRKENFNLHLTLGPFFLPNAKYSSTGYEIKAA
jgi:hypothetical protein